MGWSTHHPVGLIHYSPQHSYRGYTLFATHRGSYHANLIDMEGRVCHRWHSTEGIGYCYLLPNGNLLLRASPPPDGGPVASGDGAYEALLELDWESNVVWEYRDPMLHHDFERLPNGNTLLLLWEQLPEDLAGQVQGGYQSEDEGQKMYGDLVQEITPNGLVVYQWKSWEYLGTPNISFYSYHISSAERQPNGNTVICEGAPGRIFEVTPDQNIVWEYINPFFGQVGAGRAAESINSVFRAHRYGPDHPGLQGKDLDPARFANLNRLYSSQS